MSDAPYERYKEALRVGHVAALHGRLDAALAAYAEAAAVAPDRALPLTSRAGGARPAGAGWTRPWRPTVRHSAWRRATKRRWAAGPTPWSGPAARPRPPGRWTCWPRSRP